MKLLMSTFISLLLIGFAGGSMSKMGRSLLFGALNSTERKDTVSAQIYNCTKF